MTRREGGSVSLEAALTLPAVFVVLLAVLLTVGYARDLVLVQAAAREGARAAAVTPGDDEAVRAVVAALDGRPADVDIYPRRRTPGDLVRVVVVIPTRLPVGARTVRGTATAWVEPIVGFGGGAP